MNTLHKKKILIYIRYYLPGYKSGGPVRSISNMVHALNHKYEFYIICLSNDYGEKEAYKNVSEMSWRDIGGAKILHLNKYSILFATYLNIVRSLEPDIVYFNSFLDPFFTFIQLRYYLKKEKKVIIAPRGELTPGALSLSKLRKKLYIYLFKKSSSFKKIIWHATTKNELNQISLNVAVDCRKIHIANNIPFIDNFDYKYNFPYKEVNKLRIVFLSRISPVKNLAYILDVLKTCNLNIVFDIYGPIGDKNYWNQCKKKITILPKTISVNYFDSVSHNHVRETLSGYNLFVLPTLGENFGHAIFEALSLGIPVLISDRTPWTDIVNKSNYGAISLSNPERYIDFIKKLSMMDNSEFINLQLYAAKVFSEHIKSNNYTSPYAKLF